MNVDSALADLIEIIEDEDAPAETLAKAIEALIDAKLHPNLGYLNTDGAD